MPRRHKTGHLRPTRIVFNERLRRALELRKSGMSIGAIARECGWNSEQAAYAAIKHALQRTLREPADELRQLERVRLDHILASVWDHATHPITPHDDEVYTALCSLLATLAEGEACAVPSEALLAMRTWLQSLWKITTTGQLAAVDRVLSVARRRAELEGLDAPQKIAPTTPDGEEPWETNVILLPSKAPSADVWEQEVAGLRGMPEAEA